jgi:hypothetical protein
MSDHKASYEQFVDVYHRTKTLDDFIAVCVQEDIYHYPSESGDEEKMQFVFHTIETTIQDIGS